MTNQRVRGPRTLTGGKSGTERPVQTSTPEHRATLRSLVARSLREMFHRTRESLSSVATSIGASATHIDRCLNPNDATQWQLADALMLDEPERVEIAELLAGAGEATHVVVRLPEPGEPRADLEHAAAMQRECADVVSGQLRALASGTLGRAAASELRREIREAMRELAVLDLVCAQAEREGVIALARRTAEG